MPMLSITSALRAIASAQRWLVVAAVFTSFRRRDVVSSVVTVSANSSTAPPRAIQPMIGCSRKMKPI